MASAENQEEVLKELPGGLLVEVNDVSPLFTPVKNLSRLKYTCLAVSSRYVALGANSGGLYVFQRSPSWDYLKLIPNRDGALVSVSFSPNDNYIGVCSAKQVAIWELNLDGREIPVRVKSTSCEHQSPITSLCWDAFGGRLYSGDERGIVSVLFMPPAKVSRKGNEACKNRAFRGDEVIYRADGAIVQMDFKSAVLLVSSKKFCYVLDTQREKARQVGQRQRDGLFGACLHVRRLESGVGQLTLYSARPGGRVWQADLAELKILTHKLKDVLQEPQQRFYGIHYDEASPTMPTAGLSSQSLVFPSLHMIGARYMVAWSPTVFCVYDPDGNDGAQLIHWCSFPTEINLVQCFSHEAFVVHDGFSKVTCVQLSNPADAVSLLFHHQLMLKMQAVEVACRYRLLLRSGACRRSVSLELLDGLLHFYCLQSQTALLPALQQLRDEAEESLPEDECDDGFSVLQSGIVRVNPTSSRASSARGSPFGLGSEPSSRPASASSARLPSSDDMTDSANASPLATSRRHGGGVRSASRSSADLCSLDQSVPIDTGLHALLKPESSDTCHELPAESVAARSSPSVLPNAGPNGDAVLPPSPAVQDQPVTNGVASETGSVSDGIDEPDGLTSPEVVSATSADVPLTDSAVSQAEPATSAVSEGSCHVDESASPASAVIANGHISASAPATTASLPESLVLAPVDRSHTPLEESPAGQVVEDVHGVPAGRGGGVGGNSVSQLPGPQAAAPSATAIGDDQAETEHVSVDMSLLQTGPAVQPPASELRPVSPAGGHAVVPSQPQLGAASPVLSDSTEERPATPSASMPSTTPAEPDRAPPPAVEAAVCLATTSAEADPPRAVESASAEADPLPAVESASAEADPLPAVESASAEADPLPAVRRKLSTTPPLPATVPRAASPPTELLSLRATESVGEASSPPSSPTATGLERRDLHQPVSEAEPAAETAVPFPEVEPVVKRGSKKKRPKKKPDGKKARPAPASGVDGSKGPTSPRKKPAKAAAVTPHRSAKVTAEPSSAAVEPGSSAAAAAKVNTESKSMAVKPADVIAGSASRDDPTTCPAAASEDTALSNTPGNEQLASSSGEVDGVPVASSMRGIPLMSAVPLDSEPHWDVDSPDEYQDLEPMQELEASFAADHPTWRIAATGSQPMAMSAGNSCLRSRSYQSSPGVSQLGTLERSPDDSDGLQLGESTSSDASFVPPKTIGVVHSAPRFQRRSRKPALLKTTHPFEKQVLSASSGGDSPQPSTNQVVSSAPSVDNTSQTSGKQGVLSHSSASDAPQPSTDVVSSAPSADDASPVVSAASPAGDTPPRVEKQAVSSASSFGDALSKEAGKPASPSAESPTSRAAGTKRSERPIAQTSQPVKEGRVQAVKAPLTKSSSAGTSEQSTPGSGITLFGRSLSLSHSSAQPRKKVTERSSSLMEINVEDDVDTELVVSRPNKGKAKRRPKPSVTDTPLEEEQSEVNGLLSSGMPDSALGPLPMSASTSPGPLSDNSDALSEASVESAPVSSVGVASTTSAFPFRKAKSFLRNVSSEVSQRLTSAGNRAVPPSQGQNQSHGPSQKVSVESVAEVRAAVAEPQRPPMVVDLCEELMLTQRKLTLDSLCSRSVLTRCLVQMYQRFRDLAVEFSRSRGKEEGMIDAQLSFAQMAAQAMTKQELAMATDTFTLFASVGINSQGLVPDSHRPEPATPTDEEDDDTAKGDDEDDDDDDDDIDDCVGALQLLSELQPFLDADKLKSLLRNRGWNRHHLAWHFFVRDHLLDSYVEEIKSFIRNGNHRAVVSALDRLNASCPASLLPSVSHLYAIHGLPVVSACVALSPTTIAPWEVAALTCPRTFFSRSSGGGAPLDASVAAVSCCSRCRSQRDEFRHLLHYLNTLREESSDLFNMHVMRDGSLLLLWLRAALQARPEDSKLFSAGAGSGGDGGGGGGENDYCAQAGSHLLNFQHSSDINQCLSALLDMSCRRYLQSALQLCRQHGYWLGAIKLLVRLERRDAAVRLLVRLDDDRLLSGQAWSACPGGEGEWQDLLNVFSSTPPRTAFPHSLSWPVIIQHMVLQCGAALAMSLLQAVTSAAGSSSGGGGTAGVSPHHLAVLLSAVRLEVQQQALGQAALEKVDTHLWSMQSCALAPGLQSEAAAELNQVLASRSGAADSDFHTSGTSPPMSPTSPAAAAPSHPSLGSLLRLEAPVRWLESASTHWGVNTALVRGDCVCCSLPLRDTMTEGTQPVAVFPCGHGFHRQCVPEDVCVLCYGRGGVNLSLLGNSLS